jgi:hypothetical protein
MKARPTWTTRWRSVRLSVRALMVLTLIFGSWLGWLVRRAHIQRHAVAAIARAGGRAYYGWEIEIRPSNEGVSITRMIGRRHSPSSPGHRVAERSHQAADFPCFLRPSLK